MKTKYEMAEEYARSEGDNGSAEISFLAGYSAAEKVYAERIKLLEDKLKFAEEALKYISDPVGLCGSSRDQLYDIIQEHMIEADRALSKIRDEKDETN